MRASLIAAFWISNSEMMFDMFTDAENLSSTRVSGLSLLRSARLSNAPIVLRAPEL